MFKTYYQLAKPGIIYGNAITAAAGFFLASQNRIDIGLLAAMLIGLSGVIGSACVLNNYIDRDIDKKMARTKKRALAVGLVPVQKATIYALALIIVGIAVLGIFTNLRALSVALGGFFVYLVLYSYFKRRSSFGTVVGSISGAVPPVVGYCAVTDRFDSAALLLFLILIFWQMPHFYAIAIYRLKDYKSAGLPVLPAKKGLKATKIQMLLYIVAFVAATLMLSVLGYTGYVYLVVVVLVGLAWLGLAIKGFKTNDSGHWARQMFFFSLIVTLALSLMISIGGRLP